MSAVASKKTKPRTPGGSGIKPLSDSQRNIVMLRWEKTSGRAAGFYAKTRDICMERDFEDKAYEEGQIALPEEEFRRDRFWTKNKKRVLKLGPYTTGMAKKVMTWCDKQAKEQLAKQQAGFTVESSEEETMMRLQMHKQRALRMIGYTNDQVCIRNNFVSHSEINILKTFLICKPHPNPNCTAKQHRQCSQLTATPWHPIGVRPNSPW